MLARAKMMKALSATHTTALVQFAAATDPATVPTFKHINQTTKTNVFDVLFLTRQSPTANGNTENDDILCQTCESEVDIFLNGVFN